MKASYIQGRHNSEGVVILYRKPREEGYKKVAEDFIHSIFKKFAEASLKTYHPGRNIIDMPYYHSERRFDSIVLPVLFDLCDGLVLTELPVKRRKGRCKGDTRGRADYWCVYKNYTFVIEMKQSFDNLDGEVVRKHSMKGRWQKMSEQLNDVRGYLKESCSERTKGIIPIGLHFVTSIQWAKHNDEVEWRYVETTKDANSYLDYFADELSELIAPDYHALWKIPHNIARSTTMPDHAGMVYDDLFMCPVVMLFSQVKDLIHHDGAKEE